jgi:hypothetical protein
MTTTEQTQASMTEEALAAFWQVIVRHFPRATTGDLSVARTVALDQAAIAAIKEWIENNVTSE